MSHFSDRKNNKIEKENVKNENEIELVKQIADFSILEGKILNNKYSDYQQNFDLSTIYSASENSSKKYEDGLINENFIIQFIPYGKRQNKIISKFKFFVKVFETFIGIASLISVIITQLEYELIYFETFYPCDIKKNGLISTTYKGTSIRIINISICVVIALVNIPASYFKHKIQLEQRVLINKLFICSKYFMYMIIDIVISCIMPIPNFEYCISLKNGHENIAYNIETFLYALSLLKIIFVLRTIFTYSRFTSSLAEKMCHENGCEAGPTFSAKCLQKDNPGFFIAIIVGSVVIFLGFLLRFFELPYSSQGDYSFYTNSFWNIIVIMTTVGYGDFFPSTRIGQVIVVIAIFSGNLFTSLIIVSLTNASEFTDEENKAFLILRRIKLRKELLEKCQKIICINYKMKIIRNESTYSVAIQDKKYNDLYRELNELNNERMILEKSLKKDSFVSQEEKLNTLNKRITTNISIIKNSITILNQLKQKLLVQTQIQKNVYRNLKQVHVLYNQYIRILLYNSFELDNLEKKSATTNEEINENFSSQRKKDLFNELFIKKNQTVPLQHLIQKIKENIMLWKKKKSLKVDKEQIDLVGNYLKKLNEIHHKKFPYFSNVINDNINNLRNIHNIQHLEKSKYKAVKPIKLFELYKRKQGYNILLQTNKIFSSDRNKIDIILNEKDNKEIESSSINDKDKSIESFDISNRSIQTLIKKPH